jgi:hypothetical protein
MYIIKSGDMRYTKGGGCGSSPGFSAKISLKTAHKMGKIATAEKLIAEQIHWATCRIAWIDKTLPNDLCTVESLAEGRNDAQQQLALWQTAKVVPVTLTEG